MSWVFLWESVSRLWIIEYNYGKSLRYVLSYTFQIRAAVQYSMIHYIIYHLWLGEVIFINKWPKHSRHTKHEWPRMASTCIHTICSTTFQRMCVFKKNDFVVFDSIHTKAYWSQLFLHFVFAFKFPFTHS